MYSVELWCYVCDSIYVVVCLCVWCMYGGMYMVFGYIVLLYCGVYCMYSIVYLLYIYMALYMLCCMYCKLYCTCGIVCIVECGSVYVLCCICGIISVVCYEWCYLCMVYVCDGDTCVVLYLWGVM